MSEDLLKRVEILLEANTARFETGMAKSRQTTQQTAKSMSKDMTTVNVEIQKVVKSYDLASLAVKGLSAAAAGVSFGSIISFTKQYIDQGNEIKKLSDLVGSSTQDFQKYAIGASTAGISLEKFADINKDVLDRLGEAQRGEGEMMDFFTKISPRIGVTIDQFATLSGPQALQAYYNGLQKANLSHAEQVTYMEQIANDASLLIPLLKNGGAGFKQWGDAAEKANAIMSDEMIATLMEAKVNLNLLDLQWKGAQATLVNGIIPTFQSVVENSDKITNVLMIGAAFYAGTYIPAIYNTIVAGYAKTKQLIEQTAVQITATNMEKAAALADIAKAQSTLTLLAAEKALEVERLKAQISATGRMASVTRMAELKKIEAVVTNELTVAQSRLNAVQNSSLNIGRGLVGILGGPIGLGLTVAGVAASYLLLKDSASSSSASLSIQGQTVDELRDKYEKLSIAQQKTTLHELKKEVEDLRVSFVVAGSDLSAFVEAIPISDEKIATVRKLYNAYAQGKITSDEFNTAIEKLNFLTDDQKLKINQLSAGYDQSKVAYLNAKSARDSLVNSTPQAIQAHNSEAEAVRLKNIEIQKTKELQANAAKENLKNQYFLNTVKASGSNQNALDYATFMTKFREDNKIPFTQILSSDQKKIADQQFALQQKVKEVQESITASVKTQTKEMEKQAKAAAKIKDYQVESLVKGYAEKYNFSALERSINAPDGLLSAIMSKESNGRTYRKDGSLLTSPVGAQGSFQFMPGTARQYRVDVKSVQSSAEGATRYLGALYKQFGSWDKAIAAYNAGPGNVEKYGGIPPFKETQDYVRIVKGKMASLSGFSPSLDGERSDPIREFEQLEKDREQLRKDYQNRDAVLVTEHQQRIADLTLKFAGSEQQALIKAENERFTNSQSLNKAELEYDLNAYKMSESEKLEAQKNIQILQIKASTEFSDQEKQLREKSIRAQYDKELNEYRQLQWQKLAEYNKSLADIDATSRDMIAQSTMTPQEYKQYSFKSGVDRSIDTSYYDQSQLISKIGNDDALTDDQKKQKILDAEKTFQDQRYAIIAKATKDEADLRNELYSDQLSLYGSLLSQAGSVWGSMTEMVKDSSGESSAAYKAMFLVQQAIAIGQQIINTELAAMQPIAQTGIYGIPASTLIRGMGYASVGIIAAQTIAGIAHGGLENVPSESTYLLDKGERVLSPRQNKDLTNYLSNRESDVASTGNITIQVSVGDTGVTSTGGNNQDQRQLGQMIGNAVRAIIRQEKRQGGLLSK